MLWNKQGADGVSELRKYISFLFAQTDFSHMAPDLETQEIEMRNLVSDQVFDIAKNHYESANYGDPDAQYANLNRLVDLLRGPMAILAYLEYAPNNDLMHGTDGRHIRVSDDVKPAFEWQIDRQEANLRNKAFKQIDLLLQFLENNSGTGQFLEAWRTTDAYKSVNELLVSTAQQIDRRFPINGSRRMVILLQPFLRDVEKSKIRTTIGIDRYDQLKADKTSTDGLSDPDKQFIEDYIVAPVVDLAMARALRRLSVKLLPEGVIQTYTGDRLTTKASAVGNTHDRLQVAQELEKSGIDALESLENYLRHQADPEDPIATDPETLTERFNPCNDHVRL